MATGGIGAGGCHEDIETAHDQANKTIYEMREIIADLLEDLPLDLLDDETVENLYRALTQTVQSAEEVLAKFRFDNGIKIKRIHLSNDEASSNIVDNNLNPEIELALKKIRALNLELRTALKSAANIDFVQVFEDSLLDVFLRSLPRDRLASFIEGGSDLVSFSNEMRSMTHQQRLDTVTNMQDNFPTAFHDIIEHLADIDAKYARPKRIIRLLADLEDIEFNLKGALDLAAMYARNPFEDSIGLSPKYLAMTEAFSGSLDRKVISEQYVNDQVQNAVKNQFGGLTESFATKLMKSEVPGAQMLALFILENPSGYAGDIIRPNTAAIKAMVLHKQNIHKVNQAYSDMLDSIGDERGWGRIKRLVMQDGHSRTHPELAEINTEVMIHINKLYLGNPSDAPEHIRKYAGILTQRYNSIHMNGIGKVEGITKANQIRYYQNQRYDDQMFMDLTKTPESRRELIELFRRGLVGGGMDEDLALEVATVVVNKKVNSFHHVGKGNQPLGEAQLAGLLPTLQDIVDGLKNNKVKPSDIERFIKAFHGSAEDEMPSYAHQRLVLDLNAEYSVNGKSMRMVDLMDKDSAGNFDRYSKEANARIAIAEAMPALSSDAAINDYLFNVGKQAQLLGTSIDTTAIRNMFNIMMGLEPQGSLPIDVRRVRDLVALAGMGGLGESQLAEAGMSMNRGFSGLIGVAQMLSGRKAKRLSSLGITLTEEQLGNKKFISELEELTGLFQNAHRVIRRNIHYEQRDSTYNALSKIVDVGTGGKYRNALIAAQDRFTGYGAIRSMEDQIAMASLIQDIARAYRGDLPFTSVKRFKDLGIDIENPNNTFFKNFEEHAVFNTDGTIKELNIHRWSFSDRGDVGVILSRHAGQVVQLSFAGERSQWMDNPWISFMMQFKSYPLQAAEKQQARHLKFADREMATGMFLNAASSSGARIIRYASVASAQPFGERQDYFERQLPNLAYDTWAYMGVAGMSPNISRYANQFLGSPFGEGDHPVQGLHTEIPSLSYATKMMTAHNRVTNGEPMNDNDYARIQSLLPLGTIGWFNVLAGIFRSGLDD